MGAIPAQQVGRIANRIVSIVAGVALAVLIVQHSVTRRTQPPRPAA